MVFKVLDNHDIEPDIAKRLLKTVGSTKWTMTLAEFKCKAIKGGHTKELNSEYFKSRIARLQDLEKQLKEISSRFASDETDSLSNRLTDQFQETYMTTIFNTQVQQAKLSSNFARFNEEYMYMATLESHTCDVCGHLDGEVFKMSEKKEGINYPLIRPHCR